jgi:hypothetical protein
MNSDPSVRVYFDEAMRLWHMYVFRYFPGGKQLLTKDKNIYTWTTINEGEAVTNDYALLSISPETARELITAFTERGIKPKQASYTEGKFEATESHLHDLRYLLKLPKY